MKGGLYGGGGGKEHTDFSIHLHNNILVDNIQKGESLLILHADDYEPNPRLILNLVKNSLNKEESVLHITNGNNKIKDLGHELVTVDFNEGLENRVTEFIDSIKARKKFGRIIMESSADNFEKSVKLSDFISDKLEESLHSKWTKTGYKLGASQFKKFFDFFSTAPISCINGKTDYMNKFSRNIFLSKDTVLFHNRSRSKIICNKVKEEFVKNNLNHIMLLLLSYKPLCGYDVIKTIHEKFGVSLPQSTVYTMLYSLEKGGIITCKKLEDNKTKVFSLANPEAVKGDLLSFLEFIKFFESNFDLRFERLAL